jgi:hypothetical protein
MNGEPRCRLRPTRGLSCGPTAVRAVTGASEIAVLDAIRRAAAEDGLPIDDDFACTDFHDQLRAIELLSHELFMPSEGPSDSSFYPRNRSWGDCELRDKSTIAAFLERLPRANCADVIICHAVPSPRDSGAAHTFAVDRNYYFDNNVQEGRPISLEEAISQALDMLVVDTLLVRPRRT